MLATSSKLYPPVNAHTMIYFTLATTHVALTLRCIRARMVSGITEMQFSAGTDGELKTIVKVGNGHKYVVLADDIKQEEAMQPSE